MNAKHYFSICEYLLSRLLKSKQWASNCYHLVADTQVADTQVADTQVADTQVADTLEADVAESDESK